MRGITIYPHQRTVRVQAGVIWQEVADSAAPYGLAALAGSAHDVGVIGYALGGGISWLARKHGLASNSILSADIVDADGVERTIDWGTTNPELFWAIRAAEAASRS